MFSRDFSLEWIQTAVKLKQISLPLSPDGAVFNKKATISDKYLPNG